MYAFIPVGNPVRKKASAFRYASLVQIFFRTGTPTPFQRTFLCVHFNWGGFFFRSGTPAPWILVFTLHYV